MFCLPPVIQQALHDIDMRTGSTITAITSDSLLKPSTKSTYLVRSLVDEAINSSQLEGASTTRHVAKEMIRQGREPVDESEQMIYNNYLAMQFIGELKGVELTPAVVMQLHSLLVEKTLEQSKAGVFREHDDQVLVVGNENNVLNSRRTWKENALRLNKRERSL